MGICSDNLLTRKLSSTELAIRWYGSSDKSSAFLPKIISFPSAIHQFFIHRSWAFRRQIISFSSTNHQLFFHKLSAFHPQIICFYSTNHHQYQGDLTQHEEDHNLSLLQSKLITKNITNILMKSALLVTSTSLNSRQ